MCDHIQINSHAVIDSRPHKTCIVRRRECECGLRYNTVELSHADLLRICRNEFLQKEIEYLIVTNTNKVSEAA